jgi:hypothetical protein
MMTGEPPGDRRARLRRELADALAAKDAARVEESFRQLSASLYREPLSPQELVSVAECMLDAQRNGVAERACREYLRLCPGSPRSAEVCFRLGMLYSRGFHDYGQALVYLRRAAEGESVTGPVAQAEEEIRRIEEILAGTDASPPSGEAPSGRAWVIRLTNDPIDVSVVGRLVAQEAGLMLAEVTAQLRRSRGILLAAAPTEVARRVATVVQRMGVPALVVREEELVSLPEARLAGAVALTDDGCRFEAGHDVVERSWEDVYLAVAGRMVEDKPATFSMRLETATFPLRFVGGSFALPARWRPLKYRPGAETVFVRVDFFLFDPWQRLRIEDDKTRCAFPRPEGGTRTTSQVELFARAFTERAPQVPVSEFVRLLAGGNYAREERRFEFDGVYAFDAYCYWLLQLEEHSRPPEAAEPEPQGPKASEGAETQTPG